MLVCTWKVLALLSVLLLEIFSSSTTVATTCGKNFTDVTNARFQITSPNYPQSYDETNNCVWNVKGKNASTITLIVHDFDIRDPARSCEKNRLEILDLDEEDDASPARFCNDEAPPSTFQLESGNIRITYKTSVNASKISYKGFNVTVVVVSPIDPTTTTTTTTLLPSSPSSSSTSTITTPLQTTEQPTTTVVQVLTKAQIGGICIAVFVVVYIIVDVILYHYKKGLIYTIKKRCYNYSLAKTDEDDL